MGSSEKGSSIAEMTRTLGFVLLFICFVGVSQACLPKCDNVKFNEILFYSSQGCCEQVWGAGKCVRVPGCLLVPPPLFNHCWIKLELDYWLGNMDLREYLRNTEYGI